MIVAAGVRKGTPAEIAQRMTDPLNLGPAFAAEIFSIAADNLGGASTTTRRIEPVEGPTKPIDDR
jgi:hypothetical protein